MPKIPSEIIDRIKQEISIKDMVESSGIKLKRSGKNYMGLCPFHNDTNASLSIDPVQNLWNCLGACGCGGSVIDYVMKSRNVAFPKAVEILLEKHPELANNKQPAEKKKIIKITPPAMSIEDYQVLNQVNEYYHKTLKSSKKALDYLRKRGITNNKTLSFFKIGFADRTLGVKIPKNKDSDNLRKRLSSLGIFRSTGHDHFRGSLTIPIMNEQGIITEIYGRKITKHLREGTPLHLYLPGPHKGIFNPQALRSEDVILCESIIDALSFWDKELWNVTASYGTGGFTQEMVEAFLEKGVRKVYIAYDNDLAGNKAASILAEKLLSHQIECFRILLPESMDINEFSLLYPGKIHLQKLLDNAKSMGEISSSFAAKKEEEKQAVKKENAPKIPKSLDVPAKVSDNQIEILIQDRRYKIRGFNKNLSFDTMRINLQVFMGDRFHLDTLNLYNFTQRNAFIKIASGELAVNREIIKHDVGRILLKLEELQVEQIQEKIEPKKEKIILTAKEEKDAMEFLKSPNLMELIKKDFHKCGLIGEEHNSLTCYLALTSRKLDNPIAIIIQSLSSAGKSSLMNASLSFMPEEDVVKYTAMSGQSLFYMGETNLVHKILAISEEEGAERATYAIKVMQSEKELCIASTGKNPKDGKFTTHEYKVKGPLQIIFTTTSEYIDEELLNRCILLVANAEREQTRAIHHQQREQETLEGLINKIEKDNIIALHQNAQRLLRPVKIINPYAKDLTFIDNQPRTRRDHMKYLTLIKTITLLHQYQRELKQKKHRGEIINYIEVTLEDIKIANSLMIEIMGQSLDSLAPQTRKLLELIYQMVKAKKADSKTDETKFTQREVREYTGWGHHQVKLHMAKLMEMEYLYAYRQGKGLSYKYTLLYNGEGKQGNKFLVGLIDVAKLDKTGENHPSMTQVVS